MEQKQEKKRTKISKWKIATVVLAILFIIAIPTKGFTSFTPSSSDKVAANAVSFINENLLQPGVTAEAKQVTEESGLYKTKLSLNGGTLGTQNIEVYLSKDGKLMFTQAIPLKIEEPKLPETEQEAQGIEKSDRPTAELFIFSYCPAGSATLDAFAEAGKILKNVADVRVKFFSDMHGLHEKQQNIIQECIQKIDSDKYWDYATEFYEGVYKKCGPSRDIDCDKEESTNLMKEVGIDTKAVFSCVDKEGEELYTSDKQEAEELRLQYSPSVVINGVYIGNADRSPTGLQELICSAFIEAPEECSKTLVTGSATTPTGQC